MDYKETDAKEFTGQPRRSPAAALAVAEAAAFAVAAAVAAAAVAANTLRARYCANGRDQRGLTLPLPLTGKINEDYRVNWIVDNLPAATRVVRARMRARLLLACSPPCSLLVRMLSSSLPSRGKL